MLHEGIKEKKKDNFTRIVIRSPNFGQAPCCCCFERETPQVMVTFIIHVRVVQSLVDCTKRTRKKNNTEQLVILSRLLFIFCHSRRRRRRRAGGATTTGSVARHGNNAHVIASVALRKFLELVSRECTAADWLYTDVDGSDVNHRKSLGRRLLDPPPSTFPELI